MKITAKVENSFQQHEVHIQTNDQTKTLNIPSKVSGLGSAVNGGELLCLALATCFCNDIYREAQKKNLNISKVSVEASAEFGGPGEPGYNFTYSAKIEGDAPDEILTDLLRHTDQVSEIQNTLRLGAKIDLQL